MADEEFEAGAGICGGNWWSIDSTRTVLHTAAPPPITSSGFMDLKSSSRSCGGEDTNNNNNNNNLVSDHSNYHLGGFPHHPQIIRQHKISSIESSDGIFTDSTLQTTNSIPSNWDHSLFRCNERAGESNFQPMIEEETGIDSSNSQIQKKYLSSIIMNKQLEFPSDQRQSLNSSIPSSVNYGSAGSYGCPSSCINDPQHSLFMTNRALSYSCTGNYGAPTHQVSPIWSNKVISSFLKPSSSSSSSSSMAKQHQHPSIGLHFSNNTPFWNASADSLHDMRAGALIASSVHSQYKTPTTFHQDNPNCSSPLLLNKIKSEESLESASVAKKSVCEPSLKRPRIETQSPLPTFKVRKEKLGDRVTALQQLVSPFGKTDTASVLHEAIEYIKFLHDQVSVLSTPYMKSGAPIQRQQGCGDDVKETEVPKKDLRSRGLCLVPISSTFPVANETAADLWTPTLSFGGALLRSGR